jgi:hypothetical protein
MHCTNYRNVYGFNTIREIDMGKTKPKIDRYMKQNHGRIYGEIIIKEICITNDLKHDLEKYNYGKIFWDNIPPERYMETYMNGIRKLGDVAI